MNKVSSWSAPERRVSMHVPRYRPAVTKAVLWWGLAFGVVWGALAAGVHWMRQ